MREILFRGQTRRKGEKVYMNGKPVDSNWVYGGVFHGQGDFSIIYSYEPIEKHVVYSDTVGQFTGLTDKNGKKIFEGDIVKCKHCWRNRDWQDSSNEKEKFLHQNIKNAYCKIIMNEENEFYIRYYYYRNYCIEYYMPNGRYRIRNGGQFADLTSSFIFNHDIEVIGNIHDNPELLGESYGKRKS